MVLDQALGDFGAGSVEFGGAVAAIAEEDDAVVCEAGEVGGEVGVVDGGEGTGGGGEEVLEGHILLSFGKEFEHRLYQDGMYDTVVSP